MKIVVIGGSGLIGSKLVERLDAQGHEAVPASPKTGVNTLTGEGVADVLLAQIGTGVAAFMARMTCSVASPSMPKATPFFVMLGHEMLASMARTPGTLMRAARLAN